LLAGFLRRVGDTHEAGKERTAQCFSFAAYWAAVSGWPAVSTPISEFVPIMIVNTSQSVRLAIVCATTLSAQALPPKP
jgi:peptide methionine sulfoxide reductase MsrB